MSFLTRHLEPLILPMLHMIEAEKAYEGLSSCTAHEFEILYNRAIVHCFVALESIMKLTDPKYNEIRMAAKVIDKLRKSSDESIYRYFYEARNSYIHRSISCVWVDASDSMIGGESNITYVQNGMRAWTYSGRFKNLLPLLPSFEWFGVNRIGLRPVPKIDMINYISVPNSHEDNDLTKLNPIEILNLLLNSVGRIFVHYKN